MHSVSIYYFDDNSIVYVFDEILSSEKLSDMLDKHGFLYKTETIFGDIEVFNK